MEDRDRRRGDGRLLRGGVDRNALDGLFSTPPMVASCAEAWIETTSLRFFSRPYIVASCAEAWLETLAGTSETNCQTLPPARGRGSKLRQCVHAPRPVESPTRRRRGSITDSSEDTPDPPGAAT